MCHISKVAQLKGIADMFYDCPPEHPWQFMDKPVMDFRSKRARPQSPQGYHEDEHDANRNSIHSMKRDVKRHRQNNCDPLKGRESSNRRRKVVADSEFDSGVSDDVSLSDGHQQQQHDHEGTLLLHRPQSFHPTQYGEQPASSFVALQMLSPASKLRIRAAAARAQALKTQQPYWHIPSGTQKNDSGGYTLHNVEGGHQLRHDDTDDDAHQRHATARERRYRLLQLQIERESQSRRIRDSSRKDQEQSTDACAPSSSMHQQQHNHLLPFSMMHTRKRPRELPPSRSQEDTDVDMEDVQS